MTVCISAICDSRNAIVIAADRMMTSGSPRVEFEHSASKIDKLSDHCVLMSAGQVLPATKVVAKIRERVAQAKVSIRY